MRGEQTEGLPTLDIRPNRMAMSRIGVTAGDVQGTVAAAIDGPEAGVIFAASTPTVDDGHKAPTHSAFTFWDLSSNTSCRPYH